jgi:hypothetical protein
MQPYKIRIIPLLLCLGIAAACAVPSEQNETEVATAVAQTVQAQTSLTQRTVLPTPTPAPPTLPLPATPEAVLPTDTQASLTSNPGCVASASLVGEDPPDNTLYQPGEFFWKTWSLLNTGTCIWTQSYSLVFSSGERMGGLDAYPLPDVIEPGEILNITIYLQAPSTEGTATGYWRLKTSWNEFFGAGPASAPFYVQIGVSSKPKYGVTRVDYQLVRNPLEGCPANVRYTVYATITVNGPTEIEYYWDQSDGNESGVKLLEFKKAESRTVQREWMIGRGDSPNPRWMQIIVVAPKYQEYDRVTILNNCP